MKYEVIDNFLDKEYFDHLESIFWQTEPQRTSEMPWFFQRRVTNGVKEDNIFYMTHIFYDMHEVQSNLYKHLIPLLEKLEVRGLLRIKGNFYPNTHILHEHLMHVDYDFSHSGAILSLNTCDGYTKMKDGTKIDSVANRVLLFDASEEHCSTTTTNVAARINININYIQEQL